MLEMEKEQQMSWLCVMCGGWVGALTATCKLRSDFHWNWLAYIKPHAAYSLLLCMEHLSLQSNCLVVLA